VKRSSAKNRQRKGKGGCEKTLKGERGWETKIWVGGEKEGWILAGGGVETRIRSSKGGRKKNYETTDRESSVWGKGDWEKGETGGDSSLGN